MVVEFIRARGHVNVKATHKTTLEVTKDDGLTLKGDCIIAVSADKGMLGLSDDFKKKLKKKGAILGVTVACSNSSDTLTAHGHPSLILSHPTDMVIRESDFICERTLAIKADKAACDLDRKLIGELQQGKEVTIKLEITNNS